MPVKSVIDVEVNDSEFKNFSAMFEKYKDALKDMPAGWKAVSAEINKAGNTFEAMLAAMLAQQAIAKHMTQLEQEEAEAGALRLRNQNNATRAGVLNWREMARSTRDVAGNIISATTSLLKWTGITAALSGFGLYGLDKMAGSVAGGRRSAQGLGVTYGEQSAFGINYGSLVDPGAYLGAVNHGLHDLTARQGFIGAGMSGKDLQGDTAQVGSILLDHLKKIADNTNPAAMSNVIQARSLDQFVTLEDMLRIRAMNPEQFSKYKDGFTTDSAHLDLAKDTQSKWLEFTKTMQRAGDSIENVFVNGLVKLEDPLTKLSVGLVKFIETVAQSDGIKKVTDDLADGLSRFSGVISKPQFIKDVSDFVSNVASIASALAHAVSKIKNLFGEDDDDKNPIVLTTPFAQITRDNRPLMERLLNPNHPAGSNVPATVSDSFKKSAFTKITKENNLPAGLLEAIAQTESSMNPYATSPKGAQGLMQLMPTTAKALGVTDPFDPMQSVQGGGHLLRQLLDEFKGDLPKALAAYNWNPAGVRADVDMYKEKWREHLPDETSKYLAKILAAISNTTTSVNIQTLPGSNVTAQTSMVNR